MPIVDRSAPRRDTKLAKVLILRHLAKPVAARNLKMKSANDDDDRHAHQANTEKSDARSMIQGINVGAKFYVPKPYEYKALSAKSFPFQVKRAQNSESDTLGSNTCGLADHASRHESDPRFDFTTIVNNSLQYSIKDQI